MPINIDRVRECLKQFNLTCLFIEELGWNHYDTRLEVVIDGQIFSLSAISEKCGMAVFVCNPGIDDHVPDYQTRRKIERHVMRSFHEHLIIFTDDKKSKQVWQWIRHERGKPAECREHVYHIRQPGDSLIQKLQTLAVSLEEEEMLTLPDVTGRARRAFDVERVTKKFYDRFKAEHATFLEFLEGIPEKEMERWYVSVMINRLMFIYFIQKKAFLNSDTDYLEHKLTECKNVIGKDHYYRDFLCLLFFDGFAKRQEERPEKARKFLGDIPYLNGGIFMTHQIEQLYGRSIQIPDMAFEKLYEFFNAYHWHLDERPLRADNEINPDVLGYIFEKYINQKQMGAYYTKEDITEYISKNTVIPLLFDAARENCKAPFKGTNSVWQLLKEDPDWYIYEPVRRGIFQKNGEIIPEESFPEFVRKGMHDPKSRMHDSDYNLGLALIPSPTGENLALPTETWREYVNRRTRCLELRERLRRGEVHSINDLITLNLDIRQFAQDLIQSCEDPELLVAFWSAIQSITVLDPTCGSGAFLFAALNILEPLYGACLDRMQFFLEEWKEAKKKNHPNYCKLFSETIRHVNNHPNHRYFILKSIILNNLYGVDIMEEAIEICKLRLFLKLVAQIEDVIDIEPLPDIDFNIRAGNTLVGFATRESIRKAIGLERAGMLQQDRLIFPEDDNTLRLIEERADEIDQLFTLYHQQQTELGGTISIADKENLVQKLKSLTGELNQFLARVYNVDYEKKGAFEKWQKSHQPFHWFAEFYGIMNKGGFDIIIGNPPWVEYSKIRKEYTVHNYKSESCGNLHAMCTERGLQIRSKSGYMSFIVQLPMVSSSRMAPIRKVLREMSSYLIVIPFGDRPGKLFEGLEHSRATIWISRSNASEINNNLYSSTSRYYRWPTETRPYLFSQLEFASGAEITLRTDQFPKHANYLQRDVFQKVSENCSWVLGKFLAINETKDLIFYQEATEYWVKATVGLPYYAKNGKVSAPAHGRFIYCVSPEQAHWIYAVMQSSLFFIYFVSFSDCFHLSDALVKSFPIPNPLAKDNRLVYLSIKLMEALKNGAERKNIKTKDGTKISYDEYYGWKAKPIIDQIDLILASHYGFSDKELDFIINYDIKYRMGQANSEEGNEKS